MSRKEARNMTLLVNIVLGFVVLSQFDPFVGFLIVMTGLTGLIWSD